MLNLSIFCVLLTQKYIEKNAITQKIPYQTQDCFCKSSYSFILNTYTLGLKTMQTFLNKIGLINSIHYIYVDTFVFQRLQPSPSTQKNHYILSTTGKVSQLLEGLYSLFWGQIGVEFDFQSIGEYYRCNGCIITAH